MSQSQKQSPEAPSPAGTAQPLFIARRVAKVYPLGETKVVALKGVDLELFPGELVVLLGPSGSGKSTLLNIMGGLDTPSEGEVHFAEHNLTTADDAELTRYRREHVGFIFQFYNLIPSLTISENVALTSEMKEDSFTPSEALALVGLKGFEKRFPSQLSGGEQQRVAIARAVAKKPDVLFCDEPTGALDVKTGKLVLEAILKVHRELGTLVVLITHNAAIAGLADRVIRLGGGEIRSITTNARKLTLDEVEW